MTFIQKIMGFSLVMVALFLGTSLPVSAAGCTASNIRWASSSNTLYVFGDGAVCTLTQLKALRPAANLQLTDTTNKVWFLGSKIHVQQGATLLLHGSEADGDVDELRLKSNNTSVSNAYIFIKADWGTIDIDQTKITSWNEAAGQPDTEYGGYKRAFIQVRSRLTNGVPQESTMNIRNSDISYLGYNGSEAYGLSWKVVGLSSGSPLFDQVDVFGDVTGNHIYNNYFGAYTYGAHGMEWRNNEFDHNVAYGLDPHDNSDFLVIEDNIFHHNGSHGLICSYYCDHLVIRGNQSHDNTGNGIMLHRATNDSVVENNQSFDNGDAGLAIYDSHHNTVRNNVFHHNKYGIRFSVGSSDNLIENNELHDNWSYGAYFYKGSDAALSGDGRPKNNHLLNNLIQASGSMGMKIGQGDANTFESNQFLNNNQYAVYFEDADNNIFTNNQLLDNQNNYYYFRNTSTGNVFKDSEIVPVKFHSNATSSATIIDSLQNAYSNSRNLATHIETSQSSLPLNYAAVGSSVVTFTRLPLITHPAAEVQVTPLLWQTTTEMRKKWSVVPSSENIAVSYSVGDVTPLTVYRVLKDGQLLEQVVASSEGEVVFSDTLTESGVAIFELVPAV